MRVSSTMHGENWHSENPQLTVETGSNVTLTCTAKGPKAGSYFQPYEMIWFNNSVEKKMADCTGGKKGPLKTCKLTLSIRWPDVRGKYACQAANKKGCTFKVLELKVAGE